MFCSNCGKSLLPEEASCRHCGAHYGKERFYGNTYTSAQVRIPASQLNDAPAGGRIAYTKVDYFENQPDDDIYSNTAYRPLLSREDDLNRIEEREAEEEARLQAEEDARRAEEEMRAEAQRAEERRAQQTDDEQAEEAAGDMPDARDEAEYDDAEYEQAEQTADGQWEEDYDGEDAFQSEEASEQAYDGYASEDDFDAASEETDEADEAERGDDFEEESFEEEDIEDIPGDDPLPDDLPDAVISDTVRAHMEKQRQDEARRAATAERMAPLVNLTQKFTPAFLKQNDAQEENGGQSRGLFDFFGRKNAPVAEEEVQDVQEYAEAEYAEGGEEYAEAEYAEDGAEYAEAEYAEDGAEYAEAEYAEDGAEYAEAEYAEDGAEYAEAEYAEDGAEYADAAADGNDEFAAFEDEAPAQPKFKIDLNEILKRFNINVDIKEFIKKRGVTIAAAAVLIAAVIIGGIIWLNFITQQRPKIVDVTYDTYQQGIEMLTANSGEEYRTEMTQTYISNSSFANTAFTEDMNALDALLPESPLKNDQLFVTTLTIIQDIIEETIKEDAKAELEGTAAQHAAVSEQKWQAIRNAIEKLSKASNPSELSVIVSDLKLVVTPTPTPTPVPTPKEEYPTLSNGMMDNIHVKKMQNALINLGFLSGEADGDFGNGTESAVKAFQRAAGLSVTGVVTPEMQELLYEGDPPRVSTGETSAPPDPANVN